MGKHTPRAAAMRRHPAGKALSHSRHTGATITALYPVQSSSTATADTVNEKGSEND